MKRVSVDVGGTFTDCFVAFDDKQIEAKSLTTHNNLAVGFMAALGQAAESIGCSLDQLLSEVDSIRYATTLGTNALIERTGPVVGLLVTAGFEGTVPLARGRGYGEGLPARQQADMPSATRPKPIVPPTLIAPVEERIDYRGDIVLALNEERFRRQVRVLLDRGAQAIVIAFVNSVVNPAHELRAEEIFLEEYPSHYLGSIPVVLSHQVGGRKGEYVRASSAILDAYLHDQMYFGMSSLEGTLREAGCRRPILLVHNTGGMAHMNSTHALQTIHSGPVAGVSASEVVAAHHHLDYVVTTDMGGTSFDIGLVVKGGVKFYDFNPVMDRWLVNVPMMHLATIGAGGGSIARYDRIFDSIEVGPQSAGSDPGPACYDRGGTEPTVTDADLVLGYLDPDYYAGGQIKLNRRRSEFALREKLAKPLGLPVAEVAKQVKRKVDSTMANAIAEELGTKGYDPRKFTFLAFGGSGPLHCCGIAADLRITRILVPPFSSVFSALGAGNMHQMNVHERSVYFWIYSAIQNRLYDDWNVLNQIIEELEESGRRDLERQGFTAADVRYRVEMDMRYGNQLAETSVTSPVRRIQSASDLLALLRIFSEDYEKRYGKGSQAPEAGIRLNTIRVAATVELPRIPLLASENGAPAGDARSSGYRSCYYAGQEEPIATPVFRADALAPGTMVAGPALIESPRTTLLVEPGWTLAAGAAGSGWLVRDA